MPPRPLPKTLAGGVAIDANIAPYLSGICLDVTLDTKCASSLDFDIGGFFHPPVLFPSRCCSGATSGEYCEFCKSSREELLERISSGVAAKVTPRPFSLFSLSTDASTRTGLMLIVTSVCSTGSW